MSAFSKRAAEILQERFGRTQRDAEWLANSARNGITPRTDRDARELALAEHIAAQKAEERT